VKYPNIFFLEVFIISRQTTLQFSENGVLLLATAIFVNMSFNKVYRTLIKNLRYSTEVAERVSTVRVGKSEVFGGF